MRNVARPVLVPAVVLIAALALAGCAAGSSSSGSEASAPGQVAPGSTVPGGAVPGGVAPDLAANGTARSGSAASAASVDRSVVVTGTVTVTAVDPIAAADKAVTIVEGAGGRIDGRTENAAANGDRGSATLVLRIPAAKLTATLTELRKLGRADQVAIQSTDVTPQTQDLDARITASRTTIARLLDLETKATDTANLISIETAIGDRQADLESMEAEQRGLADQVSMSTITLDLRSDAAAPPIKPADFWSGLGTGWAAFSAFWAAALVALGVALPWLALLLVGAAIVLLAVRTVRRRSADDAVELDAATPTAPLG